MSQKMNEKISVIISVYNTENYLKNCIDSIINQTYKNLEIILIDDGSTDNSGKICDEYEKSDKRIKVVHKKNDGVSSARNLGIKISTGKFIMFVDSDDYIDLNMIEVMSENVKDNNIVKSSYKTIENEKIKKIAKLNEVYDNSQDYIDEMLLGKIGCHCWGYLIKKDDTKFDEKTSFMEDTLFIVNYILKNDSKIKTIDTVFYNHNINKGGITSSPKDIEKKIHEYFYSIEKIEENLSLNKELNHKLKTDILIKKVYLIESEVAKIDNKDKLKEIFNNSEILDALEKARKIKMNVRYKMFINYFINKKVNLMNFYLQIRKMAKKWKEIF